MGLAGISRNYSSPETVSVEVLTLPVAAQPTLRATVEVATQLTALKNDLVLQAGGFWSVDTYRNVSLHTFSTDNAWQTEHISIESKCVEKRT